MALRLVALTFVTRHDARALVQLDVLSYHRGTGAKDDPADLDLDPQGTVVEVDDGFPFANGEKMLLTPEEVSEAVIDTLEKAVLPRPII